MCDWRDGRGYSGPEDVLAGRGWQKREGKDHSRTVLGAFGTVNYEMAARPNLICLYPSS
jgi:hypothetical protein